MGDAKRRRDRGLSPRAADPKLMDFRSAVDFVKRTGAAAYGAAEVLHNDDLTAASIFLVTHELELQEPDDPDSEISITHIYSEWDSFATEVSDYEVENVPQEARLVQYVAIPGGVFPSTIESMRPGQAMDTLRNASNRFAQGLR